MEPKLIPVIVTDEPNGPDVGLRFVMLGVSDWGTVIVAVPVFVLSATEVAVRITGAPTGNIGAK